MKFLVHFILVLCSILTLSNASAQQSSVQDTIYLEEVVVTGQFAPQSVKNSVYQVRVINPKTIEMRSASTVKELLSLELGVRFSNDPALGESDIQLMGMSGQNVKILLDGVPMGDRGSTKQSLSQIDANTVERIEIIEGAVSVMYGTDALAGVINIITKNSSVKEDKWMIGVSAQEETVGKEYRPFHSKGVHKANVNLLWQKKGWLLAGDFSRNNMGGWQGANTGRAKEWLPKDQLLSGIKVGYNREKFNIWYRLNHVLESILSPGDINPNTFKAKDAEYRTNRFTHQLQSDWQVNDRWRLNLASSYQDYSRETVTTILDTQIDDRRLSLGAGEQDESSFQSIFLRTTTQYRLSSKADFLLGVDVSNDRAGGDRIKEGKKINNYSLFLSSEYKPTPKINIRPGLRFSYNSVYKAPPVIPSLNTKFSLSQKVDLRLAYGRGFRAPALRELYFTFFDANHAIEGNDQLKAEYSNNFNGSIAWKALVTESTILSTSVGGFYNDFKNRIDIALGVAPSQPGVYKYVNIAKYKTTGISWNNRLVWKQLKVDVGTSWIGRYNIYHGDTSYTLLGKNPLFNWSPEVNTSFIYDWEKTGLSFAVFYKFTGKLPEFGINNSDEIYLTHTNAYHWLDFDLHKVFFKYLTVSTGVKNILNVSNVKNTSSNTGSAHATTGPIPIGYGRSYFLGLKFNFSSK